MNTAHDHLQDAAGEIDLPAPFRIAGFEGSVDEWLQRCRWQFEAMVDGHILLWGRPLLGAGDLDEVFWHAITRDVGWSTTRWLDLRRCEMIWAVWDLLERLARGDPRACLWRERARRRASLMVAPADFTFAVTLREHRSSISLLTSYPTGAGAVTRGLERAARRAR